MAVDADLSNDPKLVASVEVRGVPISYYAANDRLRDISMNVESLEPELLDWIDAMEPDSVLYDVGASNGPFSTYAAVRGLRVLAFEPEAQNYAVLEMNHYLNRDRMKHPVTALNVALSDATGLGHMYCRNYVAGTHVKTLDRPFRRLEGDTFEAAHVQAVIKDRLDEMIARLALPPPDYLKVDVDGGELELLEGASATLAGGAVREVFIEVAHPEGEGREILDFLTGLGFSEVSRTQVEDYPDLYNIVYSRGQPGT